MNEEILNKRYQRERQARQAAESILEKKSLELFQRNQELEELQANLEKQVIARTREAENAKIEARAANQAKSQFLTNMSHALRTPLTAIIGFAEVLLQHKTSRQESTRYLTTIIGSGRHLTTLVGEMLDISSIENQQLKLHPLRFNLPELLHEIEQIYAFTCQQAQLDFSLVIDSVIPQWLVADPVRIKQVIDNLVSNGIKFTQAGSIILRVKFTSGTGTLRIDVVDTGKGIDNETQALIFDYFRQGDGSIPHNFGGTGLGLFITKSLVELMGGQVILQSTLGLGSKFSLTIDCHEYEGECDTLLSKDKILPQSGMTPTFSGRVLLVEDTEVNQRLITFNLEQAGAQVELATDGAQGVQKVLAGHYGLVLMDIQMPVMDGKEAMKSLQQLGINIPVYALTANVMPTDIQEYAAIGFTGTLKKPLELEHLYQVLSQHLSAHGNTADIEAKSKSLVVEDPQIRELFFVQLVSQQVELAAMVQSLDYDGLLKICHIIKGSAGNFGYTALTDLAAHALLLLRQKHNVQGVQQCIILNQKVVEVLDEYNDQYFNSR